MINAILIFLYNYIWEIKIQNGFFKTFCLSHFQFPILFSLKHNKNQFRAVVDNRELKFVLKMYRLFKLGYHHGYDIIKPPITHIASYAFPISMVISLSCLPYMSIYTCLWLIKKDQLNLPV